MDNFIQILCFNNYSIGTKATKYFIANPFPVYSDIDERKHLGPSTGKTPNTTPHYDGVVEVTK